MANQKDIEKETFLTIINNFTDGLLVFDEKNNLSLINLAAQRIFGIEGKEILGKSIIEFANFPNLNNLFFLLRKEIREVFKEELEIGKNQILEVTSLPILEGKMKLGVFVIVRDITREKIIERVKTEFVSICAHQLRTPLSSIKWVLKMLLDEKVGKITEKQKKLIGEAFESTGRMINLINDLLDVVKIEEGRQIHKLTFCNLKEIIQSVIKFYQREIRKKQIKLQFQVPSKKLPKVKVDVEKMSLAIQNLLDNAIRYTLAGGVIAITLKSNDKGIEFSIKDTGIGIPKDQQQNVFKKFFRGSNTIKMETEGSGLGLYVTKNIIEAYNGKIWFQSEEGRGTTFYFTLPLK